MSLYFWQVLQILSIYLIFITTNNTNSNTFSLLLIYYILWYTFNDMNGSVIDYRFNRFNQRLC